MTEVMAETSQLLSSPLEFYSPEALDIPMPAQPYGASPATQARDLSLINGRSLVVADTTLTAQDLADVQNTILISQGILGGKRISDIDEPERWYRGFRETMGGFGWAKATSFTDRYDVTEDQFTLSGLAVKILMQLAGNRNLAEIKAVIDAAVKRVTDFAKESNPRAEIFSHANSETEKAGFSMGLAYSTSQGPRVDLAFFSVKLKRKTTNILITSLRREETHIFAHQGALALNVAHFAKYRQGVADKLGKRTKDLIDNAKLDFEV
jgi:hypothetical protein